MNTPDLYIYAALATGILAAVVVLLRKSKGQDSNEIIDEKGFAPRVSSGRWLNLSERIFDPSDARWLEEELAFPKLARALTLDRKLLAIRWLEALQSSFDELIRTPEVAVEHDVSSAIGGLSMLWLVVRFKLLVSYALFVVKVLGPYHALIPSFAWLPISRGFRQKVRQDALAGTGRSH